HAAPAATLYRELIDCGALAEPVLGRGQHQALADDQQGDEVMTGLELEAAHSCGASTHRPNIVFAETDGLSIAREQHDLLLAVGDGNVYQPIIGAQVDSDDAAGSRSRKQAQGRFLYAPGAGGHEDETIGVKRPYRQDGIYALARLERQQVHDRLAPRTAARLRYLVYLEPVHLAATRKAQQRVVSVRDEQLVDEVFVLDLRSRAAAAAAALRLVHVYRLGLRIAAV